VVDLSVNVGSLRLKNPVMPASGTFAEGLKNVMHLDRLGALVTKTITRELRHGNPTPRVAETEDGMLNSIGIPSKGVANFIDTVIPHYRDVASPLVVSISAPTVKGFSSLAAELSLPGVAAIEANISCPNIEEDGRAFAMRPRSTSTVVRHLREATELPLWVKLTPNTGDIATIARAAEDAGADALVVANTILAMAIDVETRRPLVGNVMGGLSGPAVKPIIVRMVYQVAKAVGIPVIGCGGIATAEDALQFILAGAAAVQVGTITFIHPTAMVTIIDALASYCERKGVERVADLIGGVLDDNFAIVPDQVSP
jgi:dihydroorotate dehydrogenase (NAD+) catalytic subunit